jgi:hypothetical protein
MDSHGQERCASTTDLERTACIRKLNDKFRRDRSGGYVCITNGVAALGYDAYIGILMAVAAFDNFTPDNDPYGEHDFGSLTVGPHRLFWKIDYYDRSERYASPDPADPTVTSRLLTVMLASEY